MTAPVAAQQAPATGLRFWFNIARPFTWPASVVPVLVGTASAARIDFDVLIFVLTLAGSVLIHAGTNLANDYYDNLKGTSSALSHGSNALIEQGVITRRQVFLYMLGTFVAGSLCGIAIVALVGWPVLWIGLASVAGGFFYTAPPLSLTYRGLGETAVFIYMGVIMVTASSYVQLEEWDTRALLLAIPVGLLVTAILHTNNLRDLDEDRRNHKTTWVTLTGRPAGRIEYVVMVGGAFVAVGVLVALREAPLTALAVFAALPAAVTVTRIVFRETERGPLNLALRGTAKLHARFGLLLAAGVAVGLFWDR